MRLLPLILAFSCLACNNKGADSAYSEGDADGDGWLEEEGDCDDSDPNVYPMAEEIPCDGIDNDCILGDLNDQDGDGYQCPEVGGDDCDDLDPEIHPGAADDCGDGADYDCDGFDECDCDGDSYDGEQCDGDDCDDTDATAYPGAEDACYDDIDSACDGGDEYDCDGDGYTSADHGGNDCDDADAAVHPGAKDVCYDGVDTDCDDFDDNDCDEDGYASTEYGGDDCDDADASINPGVEDACYDGLDANCAEDDDYDCDGDGYLPEDYADKTDEPDCDDEDASVYPGASEGSVDGVDNDCDGETDEDAYCNLYAPLSNGLSATRDYDMMRDGVNYAEVVTITAWDAKTGEATVSRDWTDTAGSVTTVDEYWTCDATGVTMSGFDATSMGMTALAVNYSADRPLLLDEASMAAGETWSYDYTASDMTMGILWEAEGGYSVVGTDTIKVAAGSFDVLVIENDYVTTDISSMGWMMKMFGMSSFDRDVTVTMYFAERVGLVYSEEVDTYGQLLETRELTAYSGFYP